MEPKIGDRVTIYIEGFCGTITEINNWPTILNGTAYTILLDSGESVIYPRGRFRIQE